MEALGRFVHLLAGSARALAATRHVQKGSSETISKATLLHGFQDGVEVYEVDVPKDWVALSSQHQGLTAAARSFFSSPVMQLEGVILSTKNVTLLNEHDLQKLSFAEGDVVARWPPDFTSHVTARNDESGEIRTLWCEFKTTTSDGKPPARPLQQEIWLQVQPSPVSPTTMTRVCFGAALTDPPEKWPPAMRAAAFIHKAYCRVLLGSMAVRLEDQAQAVHT